MEDKESRKIKFAFIEVPNFFKNEETKEIDEDALVSEIRSIKPQMTVMVICYSHFLDLKSLLERAGLFSYNETKLRSKYFVQWTFLDNE